MVNRMSKLLAARDRLDVGYVYAVKFPSGKVKIGRTINPTQRIRAICSQSGYCFNTEAEYFYVETAKHSNVEKECHAAASLISDRQVGEFFNCSLADAIEIIKTNMISFTQEEFDADKRASDANSKAFLDNMKNILLRKSSIFDSFNIGGKYAHDLLVELEPHGGKDFYDDINIKLGCSSIVFITDTGVYDTHPNGCEYHESVDALLAHFEKNKENIAEDLGLDLDDLAHPLDFSIDIRSAKERAAHVVQAVGVSK